MQFHFHEGEGVFYVPLEIFYNVQESFNSFFNQILLSSTLLLQ